MAKIDTLNKFMVSASVGGTIQILRPPLTPMSKEEALGLAAWLVAMADTDDNFEDYVNAVQAT